MPPPANPVESSADLVRRELASADLRRRTAATHRSIWRAAPVVAAACIAVAAGVRWRGWSPAWSLAFGVAAAIACVAWAGIARRGHPLSDEIAARSDATAGLRGELRSANWFASRSPDDPWTACHIDRAATRLAGADWTSVYPVSPARRAKAMTTLFALATIGLAILLPSRGPLLSARADARRASGAAPADAAIAADALLPELQRQLEALLATAEGVPTTSAGPPATAGDLRKLLAALQALRDAGRLKDLARAMSTAPSQAPQDSPAEMKALAERAQRAAQKPSVAADVREALEQVSEEMADAARAALPRDDEASDTTASKDGAKADPAAARKGDEVDETSITSISEAEAGGGAGLVMMGTQDPAQGKAAPGMGIGGASDTGTNAGRMADLQAALRRETVEASTDAAGDNVQTDARRKTEHGRAAVGYAGTSAGAFARGHAVAPPPVPENRRTAVQTYFVRTP